MSDFSSIRDGYFLADEFWLWLSSLAGSDNVAQAMAKILLLSRKRNWSLAYSQQVDTLTMRKVREVTDLWYYPVPKGLLGYFPDGKEIWNYIRMEGSDGSVIIFNMLIIGSLYDTSREVFDLHVGIGSLEPVLAALRVDPVFKYLKTKTAQRSYLRKQFRDITRDDSDLVIELLEVPMEEKWWSTA